MTEPLLANRYRIIDKIGEGGMGRVWRVYDTVEQREMALKQVYKKEDSATFISRKEVSLHFRQEFRTMVKLKHPNTVNVFDYGVLENGDEYLTMEFVPGQELRDILRERKLSFSEIYRILIQTCQVLNFIHSRLLVHRDIKPANIRVTPEGNVKLMDFGLMDQMGLPSGGEITGTVIYLPPEVAEGGIIDARSDLYSLGIMAYELVTGQPPFVGNKTLDIIRQHIQTSPIPLRQIREDTPEELEEIILKLLAKDQNERYQTTAELINDLVQVTGEKIAIETFEQRKSYLNCSKLIGREREMQELKEAFTLTTQGKGESIFIAAPAGVGKTRLIQEFKLKVQLAEVPFMEGQCFEQGMTTYQPLADGFRPLLPLTKKEILDKYGSVLVKVIPELRRKGYQPAPKLDEVGEKVRLFEQVTGWLKDISKVTSIVICIEDLHWSDFATLELLNACIRETRSNPIMILGAFRDDEVGSTSIIFQTVEEEITQLMKLSTLNQDDIQSLIKGMLGRIELTEDFTEHVYTATAGNAFFVSETMRALIEEEQLRLERGCWILPIDISTLELPTSIEATILRRLKFLSPEALGLARIASVVDRGLELSFLKVLSALEDEKLFEILDELIEHQFMKTEEKQYIFTHDRVREALYHQLDEEKRKELHEKTGTIIEERFGENKEIVASELAYHFSNGLSQQKAVRYLIMAGNRAVQNNALIEASKLLKQGVDLLEVIDYPEKETVMIDTLEKLSQITVDTDPKVCVEASKKLIKIFHAYGDVQRVIKLMRGFFKLISYLPRALSNKIKTKLNQPRYPKPRLKGDYPTIIRKLIMSQANLAFAYSFIGENEKSIEVANRNLEYLPDPESFMKGGILATQIQALGFIGKHRLARKLMEEAIECFEKSKSQLVDRESWFLYGLCCFMREIAFVYQGKKFDRTYLEKILEISQKFNLFDGFFWAVHVEVERYALCGRYSEFQIKAQILNDLNKKMGKPLTNSIHLYAHLSLATLQRGEFESAERWINKLIKAAIEISCNSEQSYGRALLGLLLFERNKVKEAINELKLAIDIGKKNRIERLILSLYSLGDIYMRLGRLNEASSLVEEAHQIVSDPELENIYYQIHIYRLLGQIAQERRQFEKAGEFLNKSLAITQETDNPIQEGLTQVSLGQLYLTLTQYNLAKRAFQKAVDKFTEIDNKYQMAKVQKLQNKLKR
ncbi:MAG TPA: protein kinase [bacterium]|nr:protein kinase [bacterium]